jgi:hypothetical protein
MSCIIKSVQSDTCLLDLQKSRLHAFADCEHQAIQMQGQTSLIFGQFRLSQGFGLKNYNLFSRLIEYMGRRFSKQGMVVNRQKKNT